jgi:hypothetical protein
MARRLVGDKTSKKQTISIESMRRAVSFTARDISPVCCPFSCGNLHKFQKLHKVCLYGHFHRIYLKYLSIINARLPWALYFVLFLLIPEGIEVSQDVPVEICQKQIRKIILSLNEQIY